MLPPQRKMNFWVLTIMVLLCACAQKHPVLYPNPHLKQVGNEKAQADITECMQLAADYGAKPDTGAKVAKDTAAGTAVGGATGAAVGAVTGNLGRGTAAGAAGGAAGSMTRSIIRSADPDPVFRNFVETCLRDKGFHVIGWR